MNQHDAFLEAILEAPDDDAERLIFADWLTEQGDPRGDFIRLQIHLARHPDDPQRFTLARREKQLLAQHRPDWLGPLAAHAGDCRFERGFLAGVTLDADFFLRSVRDIFTDHPLIQHVRFLNAAACLRALGQCRYLQRLTSIDLGNQDLNAHAAEWEPQRSRLADFFDSPHLGSLTRLALRDCGMRSQYLYELATGRTVSRLRVLDLHLNQVDDGGVYDLSVYAGFEELYELVLSSNPVTSNGVRRLVSSTCLARLARLDLSDTELDDAGVAELARAPNMKGLTHLRLCGCRLGSDSYRTLVASPYLDRIEVLDLRENRWISPEERQLLQMRFGSRVLV
jgi:uncharacterized protein (TIGR02996 family)